MQHPACQDQLVDAAKHVAKSVDIVVDTAQVRVRRGIHATKLSIRQFFFILILSHFYVRSMLLTIRPQAARSCASSTNNAFCLNSSLMLSIHLSFSLPFLLIPGASITISLLPTYSSSLFIKCPYHFNFLTWIFSSIDPAPPVWTISSSVKGD